MPYPVNFNTIPLNNPLPKGDCPVCLEPFDGKEIVVAHPSAHTSLFSLFSELYFSPPKTTTLYHPIHQVCLDEMMAHNSENNPANCPTCRIEISPHSLKDRIILELKSVCKLIAQDAVIGVVALVIFETIAPRVPSILKKLELGVRLVDVVNPLAHISIISGPLGFLGVFLADRLKRNGPLLGGEIGIAVYVIASSKGIKLLSSNELIGKLAAAILGEIALGIYERRNRRL